MKKITLALIVCTVLTGCTAMQQSTPCAAAKSPLLPVEQTLVPDAPVVQTNEVVGLRTLFDKAIRIESVDDKLSDFYVLFSPDGKIAHLYFDNGRKREALQRRTLSKGGYVWNVEDDDTKNLRRQDGVWIIEKRMKLIAAQSKSDVDLSLGPWQEECFEGLLPAASCPGIRYSLTVRHRSNSGDGTHHLAMTYLEAENGKDVTFESVGRRLTQRGTPEDENAVVWQLIGDYGTPEANFLYDPTSQALTLLTKDFKRINSPLNYTLMRTSKK